MYVQVLISESPACKQQYSCICLRLPLGIEFSLISLPGGIQLCIVALLVPALKEALQGIIVVFLLYLHSAYALLVVKNLDRFCGEFCFITSDSE